MKKLLLVCCYFFSVLLSMAQEIEKPYDFPVKPGTKEWGNLKTGKEMTKICQIPSDILQDMSTSVLTKTCLNYPLIINVFCASNYQTGFEFLSKRFNGLNELLKRPDAGTKLLDYYVQLNLKTNEIENYDHKFDLFRISFFELLIAQNDILIQLSTNQKEKLLKEAIKKLEQKQTMGKSLYGQKSSALIISRILVLNDFYISETDQYGNDIFKVFNSYVILGDSSIINRIQYRAEEFLQFNKQ